MSNLPAANRRNFLRGLAIVPMAASSLATNALGSLGALPSAAKLAGAKVGGGVPVAGGLFSWIAGNPKLYALYKLGMLPEWVKRSVRENAQYRAPPTVISADVAVLRSVSLTAKFAISERRREEKLWSSFDDDIQHDLARELFWKQDVADNPPNKLLG